jgi:hypothetical protein
MLRGPKSEVPADRGLDRRPQQQQFPVDASPRRAAARPGREPGYVVGGTDSVSEPGKPAHRELPRIGQDALRHVLSVRPGLVLLPDELRYRDRRVGADTGVVVHVKHPHIVARLVLADSQFVHVLVGSRFELRAVRRPVLPRDSNHTKQRAALGQCGDPGPGLAALLRDNVHPQPGKGPGKMLHIRQDRPLQRRVRVMTPDSRDRHDEEVLA